MGRIEKFFFNQKSDLNSMKLFFCNRIMNKGEIRRIIAWFLFNHGTSRTAHMVDRLKILGFYHATKAGISLSIDDLSIPPTKKWLLEDAEQEIAKTQKNYSIGKITAVERFQKVIDTWHSTSETLKNEVVQYFEQTNPLNPVYMMAFSGARGNLSQVSQLVGMRGLMSDPQGQIIDLPIRSNFREGLTVTEYVISCYGARKGLVDTALRTADSGYLTRRLVDVAQDMIIRETDCGTKSGILLGPVKDEQKVVFSLQERLIGRVLAENIYSPKQKQYIAKKNQDISASLSDKICEIKRTNILVRSPLTCKSIRSVCQLCYGWSLAHGNLVDLGEAVGIIAAQSIGEPGTQLTMRTFHTGGVFTGNIAKQIRSSIDGKIIYSLTNTIPMRTRHGEIALITQSNINICIQGKNKEFNIEVPINTILLVNNGSMVRAKQLIAEVSAPVNAQSVEIASKYVASDFSGEIHFENLLLQEKKSAYGHKMNRAGQYGGLLWILSGQVYKFSLDVPLMFETTDYIHNGSCMAEHNIISQYGGILQTPENDLKIDNSNSYLYVLNSSMTIINAYLSYIKNARSEAYILTDDLNQKFFMQVESNNAIKNNQIIAKFVTKAYLTNTGGILKYSSEIEVDEYDIVTQSYPVRKGGIIMWIPEETHLINKDASLLMVRDCEYLEAGTQIIKDLTCHSSGLAQVSQTNDILREVVIKPGKIHKPIDFSQVLDKHHTLIQAGEEICDGIIAEELVYVENVNLSSGSALLIRPVVQFFIPNSTELKKLEAQYQLKQNMSIQPSIHICYKDGQRIHAWQSMEIAKIFLRLEIDSHLNKLNVTLNPIENKLLQIKMFEYLMIDLNQIIDFQSYQNVTRLVRKFNNYIIPGTILAKTEIIAKDHGEVRQSNKNFEEQKSFLIMNEHDQMTLFVKNAYEFFQLGDLVHKGKEIVPGILAPQSGQVIQLQDNRVTLRLARPYLVSSEAVLYVDDGDFVKSGDTLVMLIFEQSKTGDIVQGLPRIEELLEARRTKGLKPLPNNLHDLLQSFFDEATQKYGIQKAAKKSFEKLQLFLVNEVQSVYKAQGVHISDKHIEVIVRQMTSKVMIEEGGDTTLLPGELIELHRIENMNRNVSVHAKYKPIVLGITKASLNTESFISAASFQETTRVLTKAAIEGKTDWLRGLKENVIIGRLIPAGTGFNVHDKMYSRDLSLSNSYNLAYSSNSQHKRIEQKNAEYNFEDIIFD
nr:RNA polymerase beta'' subunit [Mesostigma viride]